jgi:hypothetical protein
MTILLLHHFFLPFDSHQNCLRSYARLGVNAWLSTHPMILFSIDFKGFLHCVMHSIRPPTPLNLWFVTLHLWSTFGPCWDPTFSLRPWWGKDRFP